VYYPIPTHRLPSFGLDIELVETERAAVEVLSLPVHPSLTDNDLATVVAAVNG
jgi:dTDP-4-amino-4,6-dideoxygalactose transaminase